MNLQAKCFANGKTLLCPLRLKLKERPKHRSRGWAPLNPGRYNKRLHNQSLPRKTSRSSHGAKAGGNASSAGNKPPKRAGPVRRSKAQSKQDASFCTRKIDATLLTRCEVPN